MSAPVPAPTAPPARAPIAVLLYSVVPSGLVAHPAGSTSRAANEAPRILFRRFFLISFPFRGVWKLRCVPRNLPARVFRLHLIIALPRGFPPLPTAPDAGRTHRDPWLLPHRPVRRYPPAVRFRKRRKRNSLY